MKRLCKRFVKSFTVMLFVISHLMGANQVLANDTPTVNQLASSELLNSQSMEEAFPIYEEAIQSLDFHQLGNAEWTGASLDEVRESIQSDVEPYEATIEGALDFKMLLYPFGTDTLDSAEIGFLFAEDHLVFAALGNLVISLDGENLISEEVAASLAQEGATVADILEEQPIIKAFAHVSVEGQGRDMVAIDAGEEATSGTTYFYYIEEGRVVSAETMDLFTAMQGTQTIMFDKLAFHYADGAIGVAATDTTSEVPEALLVESSLDVDPLKLLMTDTSISNPKFVEAWQVYQQVLTDYEFRDLASEELLGSNIDDIEENFDAGLEARRADLNNGITSILVYTFEGSEINPATGQADVGELALYFVDDLLAYASVANRSFVIEEDRILNNEVVSEIVASQISTEDLAQMNPQMIAMGYMIQNEEARSVVALQSGDEVDNRQVAFLFVRDDTLQGEKIYKLEEVAQDIQSNMFYSLGDFFVNEAQQLNE